MVIMEERTVINTREELMELLGADEEGMEQAKREREAFVHAWHLQQLRKGRGLTQRDVAKELHVSQPRIHEIERGELGKMGIDTLRGYIRALGGDIELNAVIDGNTYRIV